MKASPICAVLLVLAATCLAMAADVSVPLNSLPGGRHLLQGAAQKPSQPKTQTGTKKPAAEAGKKNTQKKADNKPAGRHLLSEEELEFEGRELLQQTTQTPNSNKKPSDKKPAASTKKESGKKDDTKPAGRHLLQSAAQKPSQPKTQTGTKKPAAEAGKKNAQKKADNKPAGRHLLSEEELDVFEGRELLQQTKQTPNSNKKPSDKKPAASIKKESGNKADNKPAGRHLLQGAAQKPSQPKTQTGTKMPAAEAGKKNAQKKDDKKPAGRHLLSEEELEFEGRELLQQTKQTPNSNKKPSDKKPAASIKKESGKKADTKPAGRHLLQGAAQKPSQPKTQTGTKKPAAEAGKKNAQKKADNKPAGRHLLSEEELEFEGRELLQQTKQTPNSNKKPSDKKPAASIKKESGKKADNKPAGRHLLQGAAQKPSEPKTQTGTKKPAAEAGKKNAQKKADNKPAGRHLLSEEELDVLEGRELLQQTKQTSNSNKKPSDKKPAASTKKESGKKADTKPAGRHLLQGAAQKPSQPKTQTGTKKPAAEAGKKTAGQKKADNKPAGRHLLQGATQKPSQPKTQTAAKRTPAEAGKKTTTAPNKKP